MSTRKNSKSSHSAINKGRQVSLTLNESIDLGRSLLAQDDLPSADYVLSSILSALPDQPSALHLMGALRNMQGRSDEALLLMERCITLKPEDAARWNDIGNVYLRLKRRPDALAAFTRCIEMGGEASLLASAHYNLGRAVLAADPIAAETSFRLSIALSPEFGLSWYGLSQALINQDRIAEGVDACGRAIVLMPTSASRELVARALIHLGQTKEAINHYEQWLLEEPENPLLMHHLSALTDPDRSERASDAYIESVFDNFAVSFDTKLAELRYDSPELVANAFSKIYPVANSDLDIIDAGCGTGLCGPLLAPWARRLSGVDLSAGMLEQASKRGVYSDLNKREIVCFLNDHPHEFDAMICTDALVYFAGLGAFMAASFTAVRSGGHLLFTVEALDSEDRPHELRSSGRYAHSLAHIKQTAASAGLDRCNATAVTLRIELGRPVAGWLITLRRP